MSDKEKNERESLIREKIRAGLSREQAESVVEAQITHDSASKKKGGGAQ